MNHRLNRFLAVGCSLGMAVFVSVGCKSKPPQEPEEPEVKTMVVAPPTTVPERTQQAAMQAVRTSEEQAQMSPQAALEELRAGNQRFISGKLRVRNLRQERLSTTANQYPFAIVVSCIDSRVPVEAVFDQGIGDVFNARVAGNVLNDDVVGSMEYACKVAGAKLIVVLGHSNCGAVKGAIDDVQLGKLTELVAKIKPAEEMVPKSVQPRTSKNHELVEKVAENNVELVMRQIRLQSPILRQMLDAGKIGMVGGMYNLETGEAHFMSR